MSTDSIHVTGLSELQKFLDELPVKVERNILRAALRAGARVIAIQAKKNVPVAPSSGENQRLYGVYPGALRDSIRVTTRYSRGLVTASVVAGGKTKKGADVYYAHMVEGGTDPHVIRAANRGRLKFAGGYYTSVNHPGASPQPFMVPALDTQSAAAIQAVGEAIKMRLTKAGLDAKDIEIEVEV